MLLDKQAASIELVRNSAYQATIPKNTTDPDT